MSQLSINNGGDLLTFSLCKFSYATTVTLQGNLLWNHLPERDNIFVVFDAVATKDHLGLLSKVQFLKIVRGGEVLEQINLYDLICQARKDEARARLNPISDAVRFVLIIVKKPLIAIRYQLPDAQIRRMQIKFSAASGYDGALRTLISLGLPIRDKSLDQESSQAVQSTVQQPQSLTFVNNTAGSYPPMPELLSRSSLLIETSAQCPTMRTGSSSSTLRGNVISEDIFKHPGSQLSNPTFMRDNHHTSHTVRGAEPTGSPAPNQLVQELNKLPQFLAVGPPSNDTFGHALHEYRPVTHPMLPDTISQYLPPKRELPFAKPLPKKRPSSETISKLLVDGPTAGLDLMKAKSALKKTTTPKKRIPAKSRRAPTKTNLTSSSSAPVKVILDDNDDFVNTALAPSDEDVAMPSTAPATNRHPATKQSSAPAKSIPTTAGKAKKLVEAPSRDIGGKVDRDWVSALDVFVTRYKDHPKVPPAPVVVDDLAEYASRPVEERMAELDELICQLINDDNFLTLCEDVENSWQRIGFPL